MTLQQYKFNIYHHLEVACNILSALIEVWEQFSIRGKTSGLDSLEDILVAPLALCAFDSVERLREAAEIHRCRDNEVKVEVIGFILGIVDFSEQQKGHVCEILRQLHVGGQVENVHHGAAVWPLNSNKF